MRRPWIADPGLEIAIGGALVVVGFCLLWDAWEGRGRPHPRWLGPLLPW
jgi:hypothetical protein